MGFLSILKKMAIITKFLPRPTPDKGIHAFQAIFSSLKGCRRRNRSKGCLESKSEAVFDAQLAPSANRASLRKKG